MCLHRSWCSLQLTAEFFIGRRAGVCPAHRYSVHALLCISWKVETGCHGRFDAAHQGATSQKPFVCFCSVWPLPASISIIITSEAFPMCGSKSFSLVSAARSQNHTPTKTLTDRTPAAVSVTFILNFLQVAPIRSLRDVAEMSKNQMGSPLIRVRGSSL